MNFELTLQQEKNQKYFRNFVATEIAPFSDDNDRMEITPSEIIDKLADHGFLGSIIPDEHGGSGLDYLTAGLLCEEVGKGSASLLSLLTVHGMASLAILRWGTDVQKNKWLEKLAKGQKIGAFGLTEPGIGSDATNVETTAVRNGNCFTLNGKKKWISFGQLADLFIIIARCEDRPTAFLVEKETPGISIEPISDMYGFRSAMLAKIHMKDCVIPKENLLGKIGFGFSHVAGSVLDFGRYSIACGCVGLGQACLDASISYAIERKQGGSYLKDYQLIQKMIAEMIANVKAARILCYQSGFLKDNGDPDSIMEASIAKFFSSTMVTKVANDAVQIFGAIGCSRESSVSRYLRDAKIMEIIEGSTQIQNIIISKYAIQNFITNR